MIVKYLDNYPYAYTDEHGEKVGIELDIIKEFCIWLKENKNIEATVDFNIYSDFSKLYTDIKTQKNVSIGAASITITSDRSREVKFSSPYLKNRPLLISSINTPTLIDIRTISKDFAGKKAIVVRNSIHERWINEIKASYWSDLTIEYVESPKQVIEKIAKDDTYFGYVDLVSYWAALQKNDQALKLHRVSLSSNENFAFIFPKDSDWLPVFSEFFDSRMGFPGTKKYNEILKKYLGEEIIHSVAISY